MWSVTSKWIKVGAWGLELERKSGGSCTVPVEVAAADSGGWQWRWREVPLGCVFKAELIGFAERVDVGEEWKGKFVTSSLRWMVGVMVTERSRFGGWSRNRELCFGSIDLQMPLRQPSGVAHQVTQVGVLGRGHTWRCCSGCLEMTSSDWQVPCPIHLPGGAAHSLPPRSLCPFWGLGRTGLMCPFYSWGNRGPARAASGLTTQAESSPHSLPQAWVIPRPPLPRWGSEGSFSLPWGSDLQTLIFLCKLSLWFSWCIQVQRCQNQGLHPGFPCMGLCMFWWPMPARGWWSLSEKHYGGLLHSTL